MHAQRRTCIIYNNKLTYHVSMFNVFIKHRVANLDTCNYEIASPHMSLCMHIISSYTNTYFIYVYYVPMSLFSYSFISFRFVSFHFIHSISFFRSCIPSFIQSVGQSLISFIPFTSFISFTSFMSLISFIHLFQFIHFISSFNFIISFHVICFHFMSFCSYHFFVSFFHFIVFLSLFHFITFIL